MIGVAIVVWCPPVALGLAAVGTAIVPGVVAATTIASVTTCASGAAIVGGLAGEVGEIIDDIKRSLIDWKTALTEK